jgi:hypothetical protein
VARERRPGCNAGLVPTSRITVIVPYRGDADGVRLANLTAVLRWLATMPVEVVLAEHDAQPDPAVVAQGVQRVLVADDGPFNRSATINAGFAVAGGDVIAIVDADTLVHTEQFLGCARRVSEGVDVLRPFGRLVDLTPSESDHVMATGELPEATSGPREDARGSDRLSLCSAMVILRAQVYRDVGGMDESLVGWGGEDDALSIVLVRSGADCRILSALPAFHLWHPRAPEVRFGHEHYDANMSRRAWWASASEAEVHEAMMDGRARLAQAADVDAGAQK